MVPLGDGRASTSTGRAPSGLSVGDERLCVLPSARATLGAGGESTMRVLIAYASRHASTWGIAERIAARLRRLGHLGGRGGHRMFGGALDRRRLGVTERLVVRMVKAPEGDFRPWAEIDAWTDSIAGELMRSRRTPELEVVER
jgi:hypothetical protein